MRDMQQELTATLEQKQMDTQKLQQSVDLQHEDLERMHDLKLKVMFYILMFYRCALTLSVGTVSLAR